MTFINLVRDRRDSPVPIYNLWSVSRTVWESQRQESDHEDKGETLNSRDIVSKCPGSSGFKSWELVE